MPLPPPNHFTVEYDLTEEMAEHLGRVMLDRYFYGNSFHRFAPLALIGILCVLLGAFYLGWLPREVFGVFLVVLATLCGYAWFRRILLFQNARWMSMMPMQGHQVLRMRLSISETLVSMRSSAQDYEAEWEEVAAIWVLPDYWILRLKTGGQFVLPMEEMSTDLEALIRKKAVEIGAGIVE